MDGLNLDKLRAENVSRKKRWHNGSETEKWSLADWSNAMCGEAGEAANIVKKIRRHQTHIESTYNTPELGELQEKLADEIADVVIYADLLAHEAGINLSGSIRSKFNKVSQAQDFPERI